MERRFRALRWRMLVHCAMEPNVSTSRADAAPVRKTHTARQHPAVAVLAVPRRPVPASCVAWPADRTGDAHRAQINARDLVLELRRVHLLHGVRANIKVDEVAAPRSHYQLRNTTGSARADQRHACATIRARTRQTRGHGRRAWVGLPPATVMRALERGCHACTSAPVAGSTSRTPRSVT